MVNARIKGTAVKASYKMAKGISTLVRLDGGKYPSYVTVLDYSAYPVLYNEGDEVTAVGMLSLRNREKNGKTYKNMTLVVE